MGVPAGGGIEPTDDGDFIPLELPGVSGERVLADGGRLEPADPNCEGGFSRRSGDGTGTLTGIACGMLEAAKTIDGC